jgi:hypothetical protein
MNFDLGFLEDDIGENSMRTHSLPVHGEKCRPTFVHEIFRGTGRHTYSLNESLVLCPVEPLSLQMDWKTIVQGDTQTVAEYTPPSLTSQNLRCTYRSLSESRGRLGFMDTFSSMGQFIKNILENILLW